MRSSLAVVFVVLAFAVPVAAQDSIFSEEKILAAVASQPSFLPNADGKVTAVVATETKRKVMDKKFIALHSALGVASAIDGYSTVRDMGKFPSLRESNPLVRPILEKGGPVAMFAAGTGAVLGTTWLASKMRTSDNPAIRKMWWVPSFGLALTHILAAEHNFSLMREMRDAHNNVAVWSGGHLRKPPK